MVLETEPLKVKFQTKNFDVAMNTATEKLDQIEVPSKKKMSKSGEPGVNGVPGNILKGVDHVKAAKNVAEGLHSDIARKVAPKTTKAVAAGAGLGAGLAAGVASEFARAAKQAKTGEISGGQFIGAEAPPVPSHLKAIQKVPIYFRSGNDLKTRELKI